MKLELQQNGNLVVKDSSDNITRVVKDIRSILLDSDDSNFVYIIQGVNEFSFNQSKSGLKIDVSAVTHLNGFAFVGTAQDIMTTFNTSVVSTLSDDYIDVDTDGDYQSMQIWNDPLNILLVKTTVTGTAVNRAFYKEKVADLAAYNTLWAARASKTYVNPISL